MKKVPGYDSFMRMNYLYQIGKIASSNNNGILSAYYGNLLINIGKKSVLKVHPEIKREICKKCRCILVEGKTLKTKMKSTKKVVFIKRKCLLCNTTKVFPAHKHKDNRVWTEKPEAVAETINYNKNK